MKNSEVKKEYEALGSVYRKLLNDWVKGDTDKTLAEIEDMASSACDKGKISKDEFNYIQNQVAELCGLSDGFFIDLL